MAKRDYYEVLDVPRTATDDEIKKAYRKLARQYHPDQNKDPGAQARFVEIQEAYDTLSDPEKRKLYDRYGHAGAQGGFGGGGGGGPGRGGVQVDFDAEDLGSMFDSFFGGRAGAGPFGARSSRRQQPKAPDTRHAIEIDLPTSVTGGTRTIELKHSAKTESVEVAIPAGITTGTKLRVRGVGQADPARPGQRADLILTVNIAPHPLFRRGDPLKGEKPGDVYLDLPITFAEAALGATIGVPTPTGTASLAVPAGSTSGKALRLRGQGSRTTPPGDLYVRLEVVPPPREAITESAQRVLEALGEATPVRTAPIWPASTTDKPER